MSLCYQCFREKDAAGKCPFCGYDPAADSGRYPVALPCGSVLGGRYIIGRVLGQGGFGVTYLAQDYQDKKLVAIKEYFPDTLALRSGTTVSTFTGDREEAFLYGKECFLAEAKTLSGFIGNPHIVRVYSYFEENGTAYFAMEYIDGVSLLDYVKHQGGRITFEDAERILLPVMDALSAVHAKGIIHRDISPDNIFLTKDGTVKLIDFGAARYSMGDRSRSLDVVLKHGYAPMEQYTRHGRQGAYTDVYSLAATMYRCITGRIPPDSVDRVAEDTLIPPSSLGVPIPPAAEDALLTALEVLTANRYASMAQFKAALTAGHPAPQPAALPQEPPLVYRAPQPPVRQTPQPSAYPVPTTPAYPDPRPASPPKNRTKMIAALSAAAALVIVGVVLLVVLNPFGGGSSSEDENTPQSVLTKSYDAYYTDDPDIEAGLSTDFDYNFDYSDEYKETIVDAILNSHDKGWKNMKDEFGDDVTVTAEITSSETLTGAELEQLLRYYNASRDEPIPIQEVVRAYVNVTYSGSKETMVEKLLYTFLKVDGRWYVGYAEAVHS